MRVIKKHFELELENKPEITAIREMRKHVAWYTKNMQNSNEFRKKINYIEDKNELMEEIEKFFN